MEKIGDAVQAEGKILRDMQNIIIKLRELSGTDVICVRTGIVRLRELRASVYENLNQVQHEYLLLRALSWLLENGLSTPIEWEWNPRQTGGGSEPDLRGRMNGVVVISAEASTSEKPVGLIDSRMRDTLEKLSKMDGHKFYFVSSTEMKARAMTKVRKASLPIKIVQV